MNWEAIGAISEIIGAIAVVVTLIYLAVQVRQNSEIQAADVRATNFFGMADTWRIGAESPELSAILAKDRAKERLTDGEELQLFAYWTRVFLTLQWRYFELPEERLNREVLWQKTPFGWFSSYRAAWETQGGGFLEPEFVDFMNQNVFTE